jgi:hypothetical protein
MSTLVSLVRASPLVHPALGAAGCWCVMLFPSTPAATCAAYESVLFVMFVLLTFLHLVAIARCCMLLALFAQQLLLPAAGAPCFCLLLIAPRTWNTPCTPRTPRTCSRLSRCTAIRCCPNPLSRVVLRWLCCRLRDGNPARGKLRPAAPQVPQHLLLLGLLLCTAPAQLVLQEGVVRILLCTFEAVVRYYFVGSGCIRSATTR